MAYSYQLLGLILFLTVFNTNQAEDPKIFLQRNSKAFLTCHMAKPGDYCSWRKDAFTITTTDTAVPGYFIQRNNNSECNLTISQARTNDSGTWHCDIAGNKIKQIRTIVGDPPTRVQLHESEGTLTCKTDGFPPPHIVIQKIDPQTGTPIGQGVEAAQLKNATSGTYVCTASPVGYKWSSIKPSRPWRPIFVHTHVPNRGTHNTAPKLEVKSWAVALYTAFVLLSLSMS